MFDPEAEVKKLQEQFKEFQTETIAELHILQRNQSSRRGPEGGRGPQGIPGVQGPKGDAGTVSREQASEMFREIVKDVFKDETLKTALKDVIAKVMSKTNFRLVGKTAAVRAQESKN